MMKLQMRPTNYVSHRQFACVRINESILYIVPITVYNSAIWISVIVIYQQPKYVEH